MRNILEVKNLVRSYNTATFRDSKNNVNVLKGISFQVAEGEFVGEIHHKRKNKKTKSRHIYGNRFSDISLHPMDQYKWEI